MPSRELEGAEAAWQPRHLPLTQLSDGGIEALKWLALIAMTVDHIDKYLFAGEIKPLFYAGRLAMPIFAFVLAYNLARPAARRNGVLHRVIARLALIGALSCIPYIGLGVAVGGVHWGWWPLNIMATLLVAICVIWLLALGRPMLGALVFIAGGAVVEFWWPGVASCVGAWMYCRRPSWTTALIFVGAVASLSVINGNLWSLAALPAIYAVGTWRVDVPRLRWVFYGYYPAHLVALWGLWTFSAAFKASSAAGGAL